MAGKLYGVGVGPGDSELITLKALRVMKECQVIGIPGSDPTKSVAYDIAKGAYPEIDNKEKLYLATPMTKDRTVVDKGYEKSAETIEKCLDEGKDVALLTLGDPTIYSTYIYIHRIVVSHGYQAEIINGIPSFCAVGAKLGDSLCDRDQKLHVIPASYQIEDALKLDGTKILMKAASKLSDVNEVLLQNDDEAFMIENCGMTDEKIYLDKKDFPDKGSYYSIIVVKDRT